MEQKIELTTSSISGVENFVVISNNGKCIGGHQWTFAGGRDYVLEGTLCDCGTAAFKQPKYCKECGQQIVSPNNLYQREV